MLRVYDKAKEQLSKHESGETAQEVFPWVRWELETKDERANQIVDMLVGYKNLGSVAMGVLKNYFRIVTLDDSNKSRCSTEEKWDKFIASVEKLVLFIPEISKTLEEKKDWFIRQVGPTFAGIYIAQHGNLDIVYDYMDSYVSRMSRDLQEIVQRYNPDWGESA